MVLRILHEFDEETILTLLKFNGVVVADFHTGSQYGFLPLNAVTKTGHLVPQSRDQETIYKRLCSELKKVGKVHVLIIAGDICEGKQIKIAGVSLSDADTDTMVQWATESVKEIAEILKPDVIVIVKGTDYHVTSMIGGDLDYQVANSLSLSGFNVYYGLPTARVKMGKLLWRISHRYPTTRNITPPMETFYKELCMDAKIKGYKVPDVFVWAHAHQCIDPHRILSTSAYGMLSPCLKFNDPYISQGFYVKQMPDIGFIEFEQDGIYLSGRFHRIFP